MVAQTHGARYIEVAKMSLYASLYVCVCVCEFVCVFTHTHTHVHIVARGVYGEVGWLIGASVSPSMH